MGGSAEWPLRLATIVTLVTSTGMSAWLLARGNEPLLSRATSFALLVLALGQLPLSGELGYWLWLTAEFLLPASLFWVAAALIGAPGSPVRRQALWRAAAVTAACATGLAMATSAMVQTVRIPGEGLPVIQLGPLGRPVYALMLVVLAFGIAQLESILRAMGEPARYSMKLLLLGLAIPAAHQILLTSQLLLHGGAPAGRGIPSEIVALVAVGLVAMSYWRLREAQTGALYVAPEIVYGSATFVVVALYLVAVGAAAELLRRSWPILGSDLSAVLVLLSLAALAAAALSRSARAAVRRMVSRGLYRSKYDYRAMWIEVTDVFQAIETFDALLDGLLEILSRTFTAGRISVFVRFEADGRFHQVRSINTEMAPPVPEADPLLHALAKADDPFEPEEDAVSADWREATHAALLAPLRSGRDLVGFVALGPVSGGYATDDRNLLRAITHHVAGLLAHARLADERRGAAEIEALHRVSAFCVHDLKNLAASLSLLARNAESHGQDPNFQESALRTVARTSEKIMALVQRLSRRGPAPVEAVGPLDLRGVIEETVASLNGACSVEVEGPKGPPPWIAANRHEVQQVLLNLLLNAKEAVEDRPRPLAPGEPAIHLRARLENRLALVEVTDRGPGLPPSDLQKLFEPFRSTKDGGLGIGLYECRRIVERLGGRIRVTSAVGQGTTFRVELPAATPSNYSG